MAKLFQKLFIETQEHYPIETESKPIYEKYFEGTKKLKGNFKDKELKIINKIREFKSEKGLGYEEVFINDKQKFFSGISEQISFLFPINNRIPSDRIGYRFYQDNPLESENEISYFTLALISHRKFHILEKYSNIKDKDGNNFIEKNLDCLEIIQKIIKNKFINGDITFQILYPHTLVELLGFCYAIKEKKNDEIEILEPYFPDPFDHKSKRENFNEEKKNTIYLEPILYNMHASLLVFGYNKKERMNYLFDMSSTHYDNIKKNDPAFLDSMRNNLIKYPINRIQNGPSCSIWFICTMLTIVESKIRDLDWNKLIFDIIKKIDQFMNNKEIVLSPEIITDRSLENVANHHFISYNIVFNPYVRSKAIILELFESTEFEIKDLLQFYQIKFNELRKKIGELQLNQIYYKMNSKPIQANEEKIKLMKEIYEEAKKKFIHLIKIKLTIYRNGNQESNEVFFDTRNRFNKENEQLQKYFDSIKIESNEDNVEFTYEQFYNLFVGNNDLFLQPFIN